MRKHLLHILTVLFAVCFGACLFAACGDQENNDGNVDDQPATYTLTYDANGGSGSVLSEKHKEGEKVTLKGADAFTYADHTLTGWSDGAKTYAPAEEFTMPAANVTMKAQWKEEQGTVDPPSAQKYTVTMEANANATFEIVEPAAGPYEKGTVVKFTVTAKSGYKVKSVKNGNETLTATDGKYSVTVGEANIVITVETEAESTNPPQPTQYDVTLDVTGGGNGNSAVLDKSGKVNANTEITLTLTVASNYKAEVKINGQAVSFTGNTYKFTVTANTTVSVTFIQESTNPPQPTDPTKNFTEFLIANILPYSVTQCQISIQAKAAGYASVGEMKGDVKLLIGAVEFPANEVTVDSGSGIYNLFFPVDITTLNIARDQSAAVTLRSVAAGRSYSCPATNVNETENKVQFEHDIYTLQYASGSLTLKHTYEEVVEKKITFGGVSFEFDNGESKIYLMLNLQTQGYEEGAVLAAKLKVGTLEFTAREGVSNKALLRYDLTGGTPSVEDLTAGKYAVVLVVDGDNYECPTVQTGQVGLQTKDSKTFTLKEEGGKLYLIVEGGEPAAPLASIEGVWTGTFSGEQVGLEGVEQAIVTVTVKKTDDHIDFVISIEATGNNITYAMQMSKANEENRYGADGAGEVYLDENGHLVVIPGEKPLTFENKSEDMGSIALPAGGTYSSEGNGKSISVTFGDHPSLTMETQPYDVEFVVIGKYIACLQKSAAQTESVRGGLLVLAAGSDENTLTAYAGDGTTVTLTKENTGTQPSTPSDKALTEFINANMIRLDNTNMQLILRAKATGYASAAEMKEDVKLLIGTAEFSSSQVDLAGDQVTYVIFFNVLVSSLNIENGASAEVQIKSTAAGKTYPCPATSVDDNQHEVQYNHDIFTLKIESGKLLLAHTYLATVEKTLSFAGTVFIDAGDGRIIIGLCLSATTFTDEELKTAKLHIGGLTFTADSDTSSAAIRFSVYGVSGASSVGTLGTGKYEVTLELDGKTYKGATVMNGKIEKDIAREGKTYSLDAEGADAAKAIYLTIA